MNKVWWVAFVIVFTSAGCGTRAGGGATVSSESEGAEAAVAVASFPSREELAALVARGGPVTGVSAGTWVADWTMLPSALGPDGVDPLANSDHVTAIEAELVAARPGASASRASRCAAREMARFALATGGLPTETLRSFVGGRCGIPAPSTYAFVQGLELTGNPSDAQVLSGDTRRVVLERSLAALPSADVELGVSVVREGTRLMFALVAAPRVGEYRARVSESELFIDGQTVTPGVVIAIANTGTHGAVACGVAPQGSRFHARCPFEPHAGRTWVDITVQSQTGITMSLVARVLVVQDESASLSFQVRSFASSSPDQGPASFEQEVARMLTGVRAEVGSGPLTLATAQSAANAALAPIAAHSADAHAAESAFLGALAGWDLSVPVRDGRGVVGSMTGAPDAVQWLSEALESPLARFALLDPTMDTLAIGAAAEGETSAVLATTYARHDDASTTQVSAALRAHVEARRAAAGLSAPRFSRSRELELAGSRVQSGAVGPERAARDAMQQAAQRLRGRQIRAYVVETMLPAIAPIPDEVLLQPDLQIAILPVPHSVGGSAWVQWSVFVLTAE